MDRVIYLDNAASSWPKPSGVAKAMCEAVENYAANPGRGAHQLALEASRQIYTCRVALAELFGVGNPENIIFTKNTTEALNIPILCFLKKGDHVLTTGVEHNSVIRPLEYLRQKGEITYSLVPTDEVGAVDLNQLEASLQVFPHTSLLIASHASNIVGTVFPVEQACMLAKRYNVKVMIDGAQTAGVFDIPVEKWGIDFLAFPGHKGLLGPQGTGGLYINPEIDIPPLLFGGTGGNSESKEMPIVRPDRYESGTLNTPGLAGLRAGVEYIREQGIAVIHEREWKQTQTILQKLRNMEHIEVYGPPIDQERAAVIAFNIRGIESNEVAYMLDKIYNIAVRAGFHCSPVGHQTIRTLHKGVVRISPGYFTTDQEIDTFIGAMEEIIAELS